MSRIMVVDDLPQIAELLEALLSAEGHEVEVCHDGQSAINKLQDGDYDLLVTDIVMPEQDGLELLRFVRENLPAPKNHMRVVAMSAGCRVISARAALNAAERYADKIMHKPFEDEDMLAAVREMLAA